MQALLSYTEAWWNSNLSQIAYWEDLTDVIVSKLLLSSFLLFMVSQEKAFSNNWMI